MELKKFRIGHIQIPPANGAAGSINLAPTDKEYGGGFTLQAPREVLMRMVQEFGDADTIDITIVGNRPEAKVES